MTFVLPNPPLAWPDPPAFFQPPFFEAIGGSALFMKVSYGFLLFFFSLSNFDAFPFTSSFFVSFPLALVSVFICGLGSSTNYWFCC